MAYLSLCVQAWVIWFSISLGASMLGLLVGIITSMLISLDSVSSTFQQKLEIVNQYMAHRKLPLDLRQRIRNSMNYKWRTQRCLDEVCIPAVPPAWLVDEL